MSELTFEKGQLVAVGGGSDWELLVFVRKDDYGIWCEDLASCGMNPFAEGCVCPAEFIWPSLFLSVDREIIEAVTAERDRLEKQVEWLVRILYGDYGECPPHKHLGDPCTEDKGCEVCWLKASAEAAERMKKCQSTQG